MLFDSHAHYDSTRFDSDRHQLLASMPDCGVGRILNAGCDLASSRASLTIDSAPGRGTTVLLTLPIDETEV